MSFHEKLAYFSLCATGFAVIVLVHYLLSKSTTTSTSAKVNKPLNTTVLPDDDHKLLRSASTKAQPACADDDDADRNDAVDDHPGKANVTVDSAQQFLKKRTVIRASMSYRPRGILARAVYEKVHNDQYLDGYDMQLWYKLHRPLTEERFQSKYVPIIEPDQRTLKWLDAARMLSSNFWLQLWHLAARMVLTTFMTQTDANGFLKRGSMFILSEDQFGGLLRAGGFQTRQKRRQGQQLDVLDIGAGDGEVTQRLINSVQQLSDNDRDDAAEAGLGEMRVFATEYSYTMRKRLEKKNFIVIDKLHEVADIDLIACLNVLDRCADPHQIMADIHATLSDDGRAIVALVLPYSHYVESNTSHMPLRSLLPHWPSTTRSLSFDAEATAFFEQLELMGFAIEAWTKAPYLCQGDMRQSFYWLIDVVVVLSKRPLPTPEAAALAEATVGVK